MAEVAPPFRFGWVAWGAWGAFLASSWTWCIGMFLPVLLLRDFGPWGFAAFAIPNVIGAAAMGRVLTRAGSERIVREHATAAALFSVVTIAFHALFVVQVMFWLKQFVGVYEWVSGPVVLVTAAAGLFGRGPRAGVLVLALSLLAMVLFGVVADYAPGAALEWPAELAGDLSALALVCALGFGLCPYLDLTFHRAHREAGTRAGAAFALGFGVFFAAMIGFTVWYAPVFAGRSISTPALALAAGHMLVQIGFTVGVHARALLREGPSRAAGAESLGGAAMRSLAWLAVAVFAGVLVLDLGGGRVRADLEVEMGPTVETAYRVFMGFYGLVFPAYVWVCVVPRRDGRAASAARARLVWLAACAVAGPGFYLGFIERETWWAAAGVGVVLAARLLVRPAAGGSARPASTTL